MHRKEFPAGLDGEERAKYKCRLGDLLEKEGMTQMNLANLLKVSRHTVLRYVNGKCLPQPRRIRQLMTIFRVLVKKIYPDYLLDFREQRGKGHERWWNHIVLELISRGWTAKDLAKRCRISLPVAYSLIQWHYPPNEKILKKLSNALKQPREKFWADWKQQQWEHYRFKGQAPT